MENQKEIWMDVPNYEGIYKVSNLGRVNSLERIVKGRNNSSRLIKEKILIPTKDKKGYLHVSLWLMNKGCSFRIHQLVAMAFLGHEPDGTNKLVVDHINNIKIDNMLNNLQIITNRANINKNKEGCASKYVGVCFRKDRNKWYSKIIINGKRIGLGHFTNEIDASNAYQKKLTEIELNEKFSIL
jgi:hypothetical protein